MATRSATAAQGQSPVTVTFVGNHHVGWPDPIIPTPVSSPSSTTTEVSLTSSQESALAEDPRLGTKADIEASYVAYLREELRVLSDDFDDPDAEYTPTNEEKISLVQRKKLYLGLIALLLDPLSDLVETQPEAFRASMRSHQSKTREELFLFWSHNHINLVRHMESTWSRRFCEQSEGTEPPEKKRKTNTAEPAKSSRTSRSAEARHAQEVVPRWYGGRCVLSGGTLTEAAHIIPYRSTGRVDFKFLRILQQFWQVDDKRWAMAIGKEMENIIPLQVDAHRMWDTYKFALRPILHPKDPEKKILVQMVWLCNLDQKDGLVSGKRDHEGLGTIANFRRGQNTTFPPSQAQISYGDTSEMTTKAFPPVLHGDTFEITTIDPAKYPLPSYCFLEIQFAVHRLLAGMRAEGSLRDMFGGDPPEGADPVPAGTELDSQWESLLKAAVEAKVLDPEAAEKWRAAFYEERELEWQRKKEQWRRESTRADW